MPPDDRTVRAASRLAGVALSLALVLGGCAAPDARDAVPPPPGTGGPRAAPPPPDADGDGVADAADLCAGTAEGRPVAADGCAVLGGVVEGVDFEAGTDALTDVAREVLAAIAATLRAHPDFAVLVDVHTDNRGAADANLERSRRRALAVARFLADEGVDPARLRPRAFGESRPRASNATAEGRAANRRVELSVAD